MLKKILPLALALIMAFSLAPATVSAAPGITVILDGRTLEFNVPPQIVNGRTMVPLAPADTPKEGGEYSGIIEAYRNFIHYSGSSSEAVEYFLRDISFFINLDIEKNYHELNSSAYEAGNGRLGYAIHDLNDDDIPELITWIPENYSMF